MQGEETDMVPGLAVDREVTRGNADFMEALQAAAFRVDVVRDAHAVRVSPVGEVDVATIGRVRERLDEAMACGSGRVILDLRETTFFDSSGLHLVMEAHEWALRYGSEFAIVPGPAGVQRTFELAGLATRLRFVDASK
jgi:anti-anti-sigma factor